jgi:hypothetical protein
MANGDIQDLYQDSRDIVCIGIDERQVLAYNGYSNSTSLEKIPAKED